MCVDVYVIMRIGQTWNILVKLFFKIEYVSLQEIVD